MKLKMLVLPLFALIGLQVLAYDFDSSTGKLTINAGDEKFVISKATDVTPAEVKSLVITEGVTKIASSAFKKCSNITNIELPNSMTELGANCFQDCKKLQKVVISSTKLSEISSYAFDGCTSLESIVLPQNLSVIGINAFNDCTSLEAIDFPQNLSVIGNNAFDGCENLKSINLPEKLSEIGSNAFSECISLSVVILPESLTEIGNSAFSKCTGIKYVIMPEKNATISNGMFSGCVSLNYFVVPQKVKEIKPNAFSGCKNLRSIVIPEGVTKIDENAFSNCDFLKSITFPKTVNTFGRNVISSCDNLKTINVLANDLPSIYKESFPTKNVDIYVSDYKAIADNEIWNQYKNVYCLNHNFSEYEIIGTINCMDYQHKKHKCLVCGYEEEVFELPLGHNFVANEQGVMECSRCHELFSHFADNFSNLCAFELEANIVNCQCANDSNGSIELTNISDDNYLLQWSNGRTGSRIANLSAGKYTVVVTNKEGCSFSKDFTVSAPQAENILADITQPTCGNTDGEINLISSLDDKNFVWNNGSVGKQNSNLSAGLYTVTANANGCIYTQTINLSSKDMPIVKIDTIIPSHSNTKDGAIKLSASSELLYSWVIDNENIKSPILEDLEAGNYQVTISNAAGCQSVMNIEVPNVSISCPQISLVTVDKNTGKNLIVWLPEITTEIEHYNIYRETVNAYEYEKIGEVKYGELSVFEDTEADSRRQAWRYRISAVDYSGKESPLSNEHKSVYLMQNLGLNGTVNLMWEGYEGSDFSMYRIYRQTKSRGIEQIDSVSSRSFMWIDYNAPADVMGYFVSAKLPNTIAPNSQRKMESGPFAVALSNIAEAKSSFNAVEELSQQTIFVSNGKVQVLDNQKYSIYDVLGRKVYSGTANEVSLPQGAYIIQIGDQISKIVVE